MIAVTRQVDKTALATKYLKQVLKHDPYNLDVLTQLAVLRFFKREDAKSMSLLKTALSVDKNYVPALATIAELLRFTGRTAKAKRFYE